MYKNELNSQIEGHFKINNELQQENEELKKENKNDLIVACDDIKGVEKEQYKLKQENEKLKEKLCHIEATMKAFSVLLNYEVN